MLKVFLLYFKTLVAFYFSIGEQIKHLVLAFHVRILCFEHLPFHFDDP